jgi:SPP1 gp7 family putative phage head morphogenesis protein
MTFKGTAYQPAVGYWKTSGKHKVLWALLQVLDKIERQEPESVRVARHVERLARIINSALSDKVVAVLYDALLAQKAKERLTLDEAVDLAMQQIEPLLSRSIHELYDEAYAFQEASFRHKLPDGLKAEAIQNAFEMVKNVPETLKDRMRELAKETMRESKTQFDFARKLRREWQEVSKERAEVIAVTEWARIAGQAKLELYKRQGIFRYKVWVTVGDSKVCPVCADNAAVGAIPIDHSFPSQNETVPAHPRCRCNIVGSLLPSTAAEPTGPAVRAATLGDLRREVETDESRKALKTIRRMLGREWEPRKVQETLKRLNWSQDPDLLALEEFMCGERHRGEPQFIYLPHCGPEDIITKIYKWWAAAWDRYPGAIAFHKAVMEEFGAGSMEMFPPEPMKEGLELYGPYLTALRKIARAMYEYTQDVFKKAGVEEVTLYRGIVAPKDSDVWQWVKGWQEGNPPAVLVSAESALPRPLTSYSFDAWTAKSFGKILSGWDAAKYGVLFISRVPVERIFTLGLTGLGTHWEFEAVVLAQKGGQVLAVAGLPLFRKYAIHQERFSADDLTKPFMETIVEVIEEGTNPEKVQKQHIPTIKLPQKVYNEFFYGEKEYWQMLAEDPALEAELRAHYRRWLKQQRLIDLEESQ